MKKLLYLLLIAMLFYSCNSDKKQSQNDTLSISQKLITQFKPIINGVWVKSDYIEKIRRTKSPLAAEYLTNGITTMIINTDFIKGDSLIVNAGYGNHEGGNAIIKFKPGRAKTSIIFNGDALKYSIENGDTVLYIMETVIEGKKKRWVRYIKSPITTPDELGEGLYQMVNQALVAGKYNLTDSTGTTSKVNFAVDGKITGFLNFDKYAINVDLGSDPMDNLDEILFSSGEKNYTDYTYKITGDTLKLYSTRANADSTEAILDKLKYTLVRSK